MNRLTLLLGAPELSFQLVGFLAVLSADLAELHDSHLLLGELLLMIRALRPEQAWMIGWATWLNTFSILAAVYPRVEAGLYFENTSFVLYRLRYPVK